MTKIKTNLYLKNPEKVVQRFEVGPKLPTKKGTRPVTGSLDNNNLNTKK